jgi:hypothetical protein
VEGVCVCVCVCVCGGQATVKMTMHGVKKEEGDAQGWDTQQHTCRASSHNGEGRTQPACMQAAAGLRAARAVQRAWGVLLGSPTACSGGSCSSAAPACAPRCPPAAHRCRCAEPPWPPQTPPLRDPSHTRARTAAPAVQQHGAVQGIMRWSITWSAGRGDWRCRKLLMPAAARPHATRSCCETVAGEQAPPAGARSAS